MIRFIDLRHVADDIGGDRFAFYDTQTDRFVSDDMGSQTWAVLDDFAAGYEGGEIERYAGLTPDWATTRHPLEPHTPS